MSLTVKAIACTIFALGLIAAPHAPVCTDDAPIGNAATLAAVAQESGDELGKDKEGSSEYLALIGGGEGKLVMGLPLAPVRLATATSELPTCGPLMILYAVNTGDLRDPYEVLVYEYAQHGGRSHEWKLVATIRPGINVGHLACVDVDGDGVKELVVFLAGSPDCHLEIYRLLPGERGWATPCVFNERNNGNQLLVWENEARRAEGEWVIEEHFSEPGRTGAPSKLAYEEFGDGGTNPFFVRYLWDEEKRRFVMEERAYPERPTGTTSLFNRWPNPDEDWLRPWASLKAGPAPADD